jgi:hypothetical protein
MTPAVMSAAWGVSTSVSEWMPADFHSLTLVATGNLLVATRKGLCR